MDTIVAISTAPGLGGIGIIRMSGNESFNILMKFFKSKKIKTIDDIERNTIIYGHIYDENTLVDEVMVSFFKGPNSYTKEDVVEINSHGGIIVVRKILDICIKNGARLADSGEFTKRAFINGRIDLTQVEAVASIIGASSDEELKASNLLLEGKLQDKINIAKSKIMEVLTIMQVNIDYPEYELPEVDNELILKNLEEVLKEFKDLSTNFNIGDKIREGISVAIIGSPNSGKSSLLNYILNEERAIVTDIAGTTRDSIEEKIVISGMPVRIIDTAGIRDTDEKVEKIGIERSIQIANESDIVLAIFDVSEKLNEDDRKIIDLIQNKNSIIILNKIDLNSKIDYEYIKKQNKTTLEISVLAKKHVDDVLKELANMINEIYLDLKKDSSLIIIHERQKKIIIETIELIEKSIQEVDIIPVDMLSTSIEEILNNLAEITGDDVKEDMINDIFSKFCLGK